MDTERTKINTSACEHRGHFKLQDVCHSENDFLRLCGTGFCEVWISAYHIQLTKSDHNQMCLYFNCFKKKRQNNHQV